MNVDRRAYVVAVISSDPLLAALLGAAVELSGFRAAFPRDDTEIEAIRRKRVVTLLVDAAHPAARDETLLGRALMAGARLIVFGRPPDLEALADVAARYELVLLALPDQLHTLPDVLARNHPLIRPRGPVKR